MRFTQTAALSVLGAMLGCFPSSGPRYVVGGPAPGFRMAWRIVDARIQTSNPLTLPSLPCPVAGITHIRVDLVNQDTNQPFSFTFDCNPGAGQTYDVTLGRYQATVSAVDAAGVVKSQQTFLANNSISSDLGLVVFVVFPPA